MKLRRIAAVVLSGIVAAGALACAAIPAAAAGEKLVCVGDSITEGIHFPNLDNWNTAAFTNCYPKLVADRLEATLYNAGISGAATVGADRVGNGDTVAGWIDHTRKTDKIQYCDILTIMLGTNDAPTWSARKALYRECYTDIVKAYRALNPNLKLYVLTSPYTPNSQYAALEREIVPLQKQLAQELGGTVIDVYMYTKAYTLAHTEADFIDEIDTAKGLRVHPGENGHKVIADIVYAGISGTPVPDYIASTTTTTTTTTKRPTTTTTTTKRPTTSTTAASAPGTTGSDKTTATKPSRIPVTRPTLSEEQRQELLDTTGEQKVAARSGLTLLAESGTFPEGVEVSISVKPGKAESTAVNRALAAYEGVGQYIPYILTADSQPAGTVKAVFRIPPEYDPAKTALLYVSPEGTAELLPTVLDEAAGTVTAALTHFSLYVLVEGDLTVSAPTEPSTAGGFPLWGWFAVGGGVLLIAAAVVVLVPHRRRTVAK